MAPGDDYAVMHHQRTLVDSRKISAHALTCSPRNHCRVWVRPDSTAPAATLARAATIAPLLDPMTSAGIMALPSHQKVKPSETPHRTVDFFALVMPPGPQRVDRVGMLAGSPRAAPELAEDAPRLERTRRWARPTSTYLTPSGAPGWLTSDRMRA